MVSVIEIIESVDAVKGFASSLQLRFATIFLARAPEALSELCYDSAAVLWWKPNSFGGDGLTALMRAAKTGNIDFAKQLFDQFGKEIDTEILDKNNWTALTYAVENRHFDIVELLLGYGADHDAADNNRTTVLMRAAKTRCPEMCLKIIAKLLDAGSNPLAEDLNGKTALTYAAESGCADAIKELLSKKKKNGEDRNVELDINAKDNLGMTALMHACSGGYMDAVGALLDKGADVRAVDNGQKTPLMFAAMSGNTGIIQMLGKGGADANAIDKDGQTALKWAVIKGKTEAVNILFGATTNKDAVDIFASAAIEAMHKNDGAMQGFLKSGTLNANSIIDHGETTVLIWAACYGYSSIVKMLLETADVKLDAANSDGVTSLMLAINNDHTEIAKMLIEKGAGVDLISKNENTALMFAAMRGNLEVVEIIISKGGKNLGNANRNGATALIVAINNDHTAVARALIGAIKGREDISIDAIDNNGWRALALAAARGNLEIVEKLIDARASISAVSKSGATALMYAIDKNHTEVAEKIVDATERKDIDAPGPNGQTALMLAAMLGNLKVVIKLLEKGAKVGAANKDGVTALMYAIDKNHTEVAEKIVDATERKDIDAPGPNGQTALMKAAAHGNLDVVIKLLEKGAKVHVANNDGVTAPMFAIDKGHNEVAKALIEAIKGKGDIINAVDNNGRTLLMFAAMLGNLKIVEKLIDAGADVNFANGDGWTALMLAVRKLHVDVARKISEKCAYVSIGIFDDDEERALNAKCTTTIKGKGFTATFESPTRPHASLSMFSNEDGTPAETSRTTACEEYQPKHLTRKDFNAFLKDNNITTSGCAKVTAQPLEPVAAAQAKMPEEMPEAIQTQPVVAALAQSRSGQLQLDHPAIEGSQSSVLPSSSLASPITAGFAAGAASKVLELLPERTVSKEVVKSLLNAGFFVTAASATVQAAATGEVLPLMPLVGAAASMAASIAVNNALERSSAFKGLSDSVKSKVRFAVSAACASASYLQVGLGAAAFAANVGGYAAVSAAKKLYDGVKGYFIAEDPAQQQPAM